jgi:hypothetical protein
MVGSGGSEKSADHGVIGRLLNEGSAAYNAHDSDAFRSVFAPDFVGVDHRPASLGRFSREDFLAFANALWCQVRSNHFGAVWVETLGDVGLIRTLETAETLDGGAIEYEGFIVVVARDGKNQSWDMFPPEAEADARALFVELASAQQA